MLAFKYIYWSKHTTDNDTEISIPQSTKLSIHIMVFIPTSVRNCSLHIQSNRQLSSRISLVHTNEPTLWVPIEWYADEHTHPFYSPMGFVRNYPGERYQKGKTNLDFTETRDSEWRCHQLGHMQICTSPQTDNHASFLQAGCPSCRTTNSISTEGMTLNKQWPSITYRIKLTHVTLQSNKPEWGWGSDIPVAMPKSVGAKGNLWHFRSSEQHADGCISLAVYEYDFLLVFQSNHRSGQNHCYVISR